MKIGILVLSILGSLSIMAMSPVLNIEYPVLEDALFSIGNSYQQEITQKQVSILVWNTHKENYTIKWQQEFLKFKSQADFFLLQESIGRIDRDYPVVYDGLEGVVGETFYYHGIKSGNLTLSKFHSIENKLLFSNAKEPIALTPKPILLTKYQINDSKQLLLVNVHAINFVGLQKFKHQIESMYEQVRTFKGVLIIAGDFNTWSAKRTKFLINKMKSLSLHTVHFTHDDCIKRYLGHKLDHVFIRGVKTIQAKCLVTKSSDHHPLLITIKL